MFDFKRAVERLKKYRQSTESLKRQVKEVEARWRALHQELYDRKAEAQRRLIWWDGVVRKAIEFRYRRYGERHPFGALGVRVSFVPVYDPEDAFKYALEHHPEFLALDTKRFDKFLKALLDGGGEVPFDVILEERVTPTIPKSL